MAIITAESHPLLHKACETIFHDSGGGAGHPSYEIPERCDAQIEATERALGTLDENEFETFCIGEFDEMMGIALRTADLGVANKLLTEFFDEYC